MSRNTSQEGTHMKMEDTQQKILSEWKMNKLRTLISKILDL